MTSTPHPSGRIRWALLSLALLVSAAMPVATASASPARVQVIVQMEPGHSADSAIAEVRRSGGRVTGELELINGFGARLTPGAAASLQRAEGVKHVTRDSAIEPQQSDYRAPRTNTERLSTAYPSSVDAPEAWNHDLSRASGRGVGVAVIDTGIAGDMPDFSVAGPSRDSRVVASVVTNPDATTAADTHGHGTHVAGIIGGNGWERSDSLRGKYLGIAPQADLISVKISDDAGQASVLDVLYGLQFVVDHKDAYNIRVVNLSLESTTPGSYKTDPLNAAVEAAWFKGIVVVAAAGNRGSAADAVSYAPGNDPFVISVGSVDDQASQRDGDDSRPVWSSRGVTQDGYAKPELHAPGSGIVSTLAPGSSFTALCPTCIVDGEMIRAGGTSMSAPMVSGAVALILEKAPWLTPDQVKGVLMRSARMVNRRFPAVDVFKALTEIYYGRTAPANQGLVPNEIVDASTGAIDYSRSSWSRSSWSTASGNLAAGFSRSSWSCVCDPTAAGEDVETSRSSWSRSSWSRSSWSMSWNK